MNEDDSKPVFEDEDLEIGELEIKLDILQPDWTIQTQENCPSIWNDTQPLEVSRREQLL